jgi:hypothetical protein
MKSWMDCRLAQLSADSVALEGKFGGAEEDRTPDLRIANATLSQLSYRPIPVDSIDCRMQTQVGGTPYTEVPI